MDALRDTPSDITKSLAEFGGMNAYSKPMWRVVLSQNHTSKKRGIWHEFADGTIEQFAIVDGKWQYNPIHAVRVIDEVRETPVFPVKGWILERWFPATHWGSPADWPVERGPYPSEGDYWMLGGPWDEMPEIGDLKRAISLWIYEWERRPKSLDAAFKAFADEERAQREAEIAKYDAELDAFFRGEIKPIFNSTSLAAQAVRNEAAESVGIRSHIGAGQ